MRFKPFLAACLFLSGAFAIIPSGSALIDSTTWTEEVPGIADSAVQVTLAGDVDKQALIWERANATWGFALRESGSWSLPNLDVTGAWQVLDNADLCYLGSDTWLAAGADTATLYLYESTDDGATWGQVSTWPNLHASGTFGLECQGSTLVLAWRTPGGVGVDAVNGTVGTKSGGSWDFSADQVVIPAAGLSIIRSIDVGITATRHYVALADRVKFQFTYSDDDGAFWAAAATVGPASSSCSTECRVSVDGYGNSNDWVISGTYYDGVEAIPWTEHNEAGEVAVLGPPTGLLCAANRCENGVDEFGRVLSGLPRTAATNRLYLDSNDGAGFVEQTGDDIPTALDMSSLLDGSLAMVAYVDDDQGDRVEVRHAVILPPVDTYVNPNGLNWGEVRTSWDEPTSAVFAKEAGASSDANFGNVFKLNPSTLDLVVRWDACPFYVTRWGGDLTQHSTLGTLGGLTVNPSAANEVITACAGDFGAFTSDFFYLSVFTSNGGLLGIMPINNDGQVDDPSRIDACFDNHVAVQHLSDTSPVNFSAVSLEDVGSLPFTAAQDHGTLWNAAFAGLNTIGIDVTYQHDNCRYYTISAPGGSGLTMNQPTSTEEVEWQNLNIDGTGVVAYGGSVWVADDTTMTRFTDEGTSFTVAFTDTVTTDILDGVEQLRISKDGAYLMAACSATSVCVFNSTSFEVVFTAPVLAGTMSYDMDAYNENLYVASGDTVYRFDIASLTSSFGDEDNCQVAPLPPSCPNAPVTSTTTSTTLGPDGVGGESGGFIATPGSGVPGLGADSLSSIAEDMGISVQALAWLLGIILVTMITLGMGASPMATGGSFSIPMAVLGGLLGLGLSVAMSLIPVWFVIVVGLLGAGLLVVSLRR